MDALSDLEFFARLARHASLSAAARELGLTPPAVSKRLAALEQRLDVRLLQRTTRRLALTPEGALYHARGRAVLEGLQALESEVRQSRSSLSGVLRVAASFGFGRRHVAPALSSFVQQHPDLQVQLTLADRPPSVIDGGVDLQVRVGNLPDARLRARLLARNRRLLCAAPAYLRRAGLPQAPTELARHACLFIRENDETLGSWTLRQGRRRETVKVGGPLASNDGECVLAWALEGQGILVRSEWEVAALLRAGRLRQVLPDWQLPPADVYAVFPTREHLPAKTRALIDHLFERMAPHRLGDGGW